MRLTVNFSLCFFCLVQANICSAQLDFKETNNGGTMQLSDQTGKSLAHNNYDPGVEGSPFIANEFSLAEVTLVKGQLFKNVKAKFNLERNELYFIDSYGDTLAAAAGAVKKVNFLSPLSKEGISYTFKTGYPVIDKQSGNYFYQSIEEGKIELLKKYSKKIETFKNDMSGDIRKEFVESSFYYVFSDGVIKPLRYDKAFILSLMPGKDADMQKFLSENKINFKKVNDIQKLVHYYNSL